MKINEISTPSNVNEGIGSALIGDRAAAAVRGFFSGKGTKHTMYQQAFLKDFYQDAITSLDNGIRGGFIDPNAASGDLATGAGDTGADTQVNPADVKPGSAPAPGAAPGAAAAAANKNQRQTNQTLNNYIKQAASTINKTTDKAQKIALTKELVNAMADRKDYPEWENALGTVQQVIKSGNVDPNFATAAISNLKAGKTMAEAYKIYYMNMLVESVGLTWNDIGLCVIRQNNKLYIAEQKFVKMNNLFESIMQLTENQALPIARYMSDWFNAYMQGTNWKSYESQVLPMLQQIEATYSKDKGKAAIKQLANAAFSISKLSPTKPKGAPEPTGDQKTDAEPSGNNMLDTIRKAVSGGNNAEVEAQLAAAKKANPEAFARVAAQP
jgi:hypothetical protein